MHSSLKIVFWVSQLLLPHSNLRCHLLWGRFVRRDSGGRETDAVNAQDAVGAAHAARAPGAGCGWREAKGAAEGGGCGGTTGRGCVGGGGCHCCFLHQESAGRSRQSEAADWNQWAYPSMLMEKKQHKYSKLNIQTTSLTSEENHFAFNNCSLFP